MPENNLPKAPENVYVNRIPPHDQDAEQAILGCMLFDSDGLSVAFEKLNGDDFYRADHKIIFESMIELFSENIQVDLITLKNRLEKKGVLEQVGGINYIAELAGTVSTSARINDYIKIVYEKSILRKLIKASAKISEASYSAKENLDDVLNTAEQSIFSILQNQKSEDFTHINDILIPTIDKIEELYYSKEKITGIKTGFIDFDYKTAGLHPSDLILIAARPSMGKTAFALNIALYAAVENKIPTAIFSLEMSKEQLVNRLICAQAMIDAQKLRTGTADSSDWEKIAQATGELSEAPIYINDVPGINSMQLRAMCRKLKLETGLGLIIIDYLQLMSGHGKNDSRQQEISEISRSLKAIAREMDAPVIALSQLSRACETRSDHRPMLSDLRESGAIEQDADLVAFLYRDEYYNENTEDKNIAEVIIAKQRNGPIGTVKLMWLGSYTKFVNMEKRENF